MSKIQLLEDPRTIERLESIVTAHEIPDHLSTSFRRHDRVDLKKTRNQRIIGKLLELNYRGKPCRFEGLENIPERAVFFGINHGPTQYPYWPFQLEFYQQTGKFTTVWVKGKHMDHDMLIRKVFEEMGLIPINDKKYVKETLRGANEEEIKFYHEQLLLRSGINTQKAIEQGLSVIIFPDGTRDKKVGKGNEGIIHAAYHTDAPVIPIGCSFAERIYPERAELEPTWIAKTLQLPPKLERKLHTPSFWAKKTRDYDLKGPPTYMIGTEVDLDYEREQFRRDEEKYGPSLPLSLASKERHQKILTSGTEKLMREINKLVDNELRNEDYL